MALTIQDIENAIIGEVYMPVGEKTTICLLRLYNGYEVIGTAACVDAKDYDIEIGKKYAREKAIDKVWELLGFLNQEALLEAKTE